MILIFKKSLFQCITWFESSLILKNSKKEKIIKFKLDERYPELVTSLPGYVHDIKNIGKKKLVVLVWANEVYQKNKPDTFFGEV